MANIIIGCVADDFTGASDIASFFVKSGLETLLINELPDPGFQIPARTGCIVIALKTRTMETAKAVSESIAAFRWLKEHGAGKLYFKYCSTFDSGRTGNIGPVIDAVLAEYQLPYTVLCPSLPVNGRTVRDGKLYVNGVPLDQSHMKDHPLTPMWDSYLPALMKDQGQHPCYILKAGQLKQTFDPGGMSRPCYLIPDYYEEEHGREIAETFSACEFFTGGSGLGGHLAAQLQMPERAGRSQNVMYTSGKGIILAGSCSAVTLRQIAAYQEQGYPSYRIDPAALLAGTEHAERVFRWIEQQREVPLIYTFASPEELETASPPDREQAAVLLEQFLASLAVWAAANGRRRIIVAGGETSGAVTKALGYKTFLIAGSITPGVPVMIPEKEPAIRLVLKSGSFGAADFFDRAVTLTEDAG